MPTKNLSRIHALIRHALEEHSARGHQGDLPEGKVTLRLQAVDYYWLTQLAELMDGSRTRAASQLLSAAIRDAAEAAGLPTEGDDFQDAFRAFLDQEFPHETSPPHHP
ncbi:hypothetical protein GCM10008956_09460 [Deinococcus arenae]|uniref:Uncharacterized protein n=2 Tax=Deinococcus TaxID=1298 RepID=A0A8H9GKK1_9DEIO|nr:MULTISPECIES: hypothetical protein [Deinococcus]ALW88652.1 hypothetical protein AUC44_06865 [Deinococcus actinosclerus]GGM35162.1 hypothetical protein GCM10008956_09460 [Deinococcus arenae]